MDYPAGQFAQSESDLSIVHPVKTTADGEFISHSVSHHFTGGRVRRDLQPLGLEGQVYYKVSYKGRSLMFNLTANHHLVSSDYILEKRNGTANRTEHRLSEGNSCHLLGTVEASDVRGTAAISTCKGLVRNHVAMSITGQKRCICGEDHIYLRNVVFLTGRVLFKTQEASIWCRQS